MSAADAQAEPTMEEILASIRRIISEDDAGPASEPAPSADDSFGEDVLELNEPVEAMPETVSPDFDFDALPVEEPDMEPAFDELVVEDRFDEPEPVYTPAPEPVVAWTPPPVAQPMPQPAPQPAPRPAFPFDQGLVSDPIADAASSAFSKLATNGLPGMFVSGNTVEGLVGELLKPMLRDWLDANLSRIVEEKVEAEVARIARRSF